MKKDYDISKQFQDDIVKAYNSVANTSWTQEDAYKKVMEMPAPRYYVSAKQAAQILSPMVRGDFERVNLMKPNRRRMYYSIFKRVIELSERRAFIGKPLAYIVRYAVVSPAPEFFVSLSAIAKVRSFLKKGHFDDDGKCKSIPSREKAYEKLKERRNELKAWRASHNSH